MAHVRLWQNWHGILDAGHRTLVILLEAKVQSLDMRSFAFISLLSCSLLLDPSSRQGRPLSEWIRQLRKELECQAMTRQKLEEKVGSILSRGGATELKSAQNLVRQLQEPLTNAIIREQRSVSCASIKRHHSAERGRALHLLLREVETKRQQALTYSSSHAT